MKLKFGILLTASLIVSIPTFAAPSPGRGLFRAANTAPSRGALGAWTLNDAGLQRSYTSGQHLKLGHDAPLSLDSVPKPQATYSYDSTVVPPLTQTFYVIEVDGHIIMKLSMNDQPKGTHIIAESEGGTIYDPENGVTTLKSPSSIKASQGDKSLWNLSFPTSTVTIKQVTVPNFTFGVFNPPTMIPTTPAPPAGN
jgi:hypothetical protein